MSATNLTSAVELQREKYGREQRLRDAAPDLLAACEAALEVAKISFNPHPEDEASTITLGRGTLQHLANHLAGAIAKARGV